MRRQIVFHKNGVASFFIFFCKVGMGISKMIFMNFYNYRIKGSSGGLV